MSAPQRFRKKPVEIEAMQWNGGLTSSHDTPARSASTIIDWVLAHGGTARYVNIGEDHPLRYADELYRHAVVRGDRSAAKDAPAFIVIETLEGPHRTNPLDYVIRGVQGEFYPCKPDIFEQTYDEMHLASAAPTAERAEPRSLFSPRVHALTAAILASPRALDERIGMFPDFDGVGVKVTVSAVLDRDELRGIERAT